MAKILKPKIQATGVIDAFEMGVFKVVGEKTLKPVIGNGTVMSGATKTIAGAVIPSISRNKHVGLFASAMVIDGVEDLVHGLLGDLTGGSGSNGGW